MSSPAARIAGIIAAAGESRRFGSAKLLAELGGQPLIRRAVERVLRAQLQPTIVVVRPESDDIRLALGDLPVEFTVNPDPSRGLASSIAAGVAAVPAGADAVIVTLGDQPFLEPGIIEELCAAWQRTRARIVAPEFRGQVAPPVLFARGVFPELLEAGGEAGARAVINRDPARVHIVKFDQPAPADVDTPEDLARLLS